MHFFHLVLELSDLLLGLHEFRVELLLQLRDYILVLFRELGQLGLVFVGLLREGQVHFLLELLQLLRVLVGHRFERKFRFLQRGLS